jgi:hypothetical protein
VTSDEPQAPPGPPRKFRVHLLVRDAGGLVQSRQGGTAFPVGSDSRWRIACDPALVMDGEIERGTSEWWAVRCRACRATAEYQDDRRARPDPRVRGGRPDESEP